MAAVCIEDVGQIAEQRIAMPGFGEDDGDGADGFGGGAVDGGTDNRPERADAVTASEKGKVAIGDATDQRQQLGFHAALRLRFRVCSVADVVRSAAQNDARPGCEVDVSQWPVCEPD